MTKPELLLPVGNIEAFYAALKGGADAMYLGLKNFNARGRASNFNNFQFQLIINEAAKHNVKVYVTLNTVIKNKEISELTEVLWFLSKTKVSAVIIQDWGTYYILKKYFPQLVIHASTQMGNHNSLGVNFSKKTKFERVILARELTLSELTDIHKKTDLETEVFVHGALCYSFSGMCNFSSYLGGAGANRGLCTQPCRRFYNTGSKQQLVFSLKDNQLVDYVQDLAKTGVSSLKIEGRLKSGEYVYQVAQAYRKAIDENKINIARNMLKLDLGREKTQWFYAKNVKDAISETPNTGLYLGKIIKVSDNSFTFSSTEKLEKGNRLRIQTKSNSEQETVKLNEFIQHNDFTVEVKGRIDGLKQGNDVYLAGLRQMKFQTKLKGNAKNIQQIPFKLKKEIVSSVRKFKPENKQTVYVRIDSIDWLRKIRLDDIDNLILQLRKSNWSDFNPKVPFIQKNRHKIWIEFPQFISEKDIEFYKNLAFDFNKQGFKQFVLSHLSQKELLPKGAVFGTNENVYCYNDAAIKAVKEQGSKWVTSPFENEYDNLLSGANRCIVVPMHYYPKLFYSRQPVKTGNKFYDDNNREYSKHVVNGITIVVPDKPVSLLQYREKLSGKGFNSFFIDLSFEKPSKHTIKRLLIKLKRSEQEQPSTTFNFKKGFK
jgi:putative protease